MKQAARLAGHYHHELLGYHLDLGAAWLLAGTALCCSLAKVAVLVAAKAVTGACCRQPCAAICPAPVETLCDSMTGPLCAEAMWAPEDGRYVK
jgi:hypothetical protein